MPIRLPQQLTSRYNLQYFELMVTGLLVQGHVWSTRPSPGLPAMFHKLLRLMPYSVYGHRLVGPVLAPVPAICHDACDGHQCLPDVSNLLNYCSTVAGDTEPTLLPMLPLYEHGT